MKYLHFSSDKGRFERTVCGLCWLLLSVSSSGCNQTPSSNPVIGTSNQATGTGQSNTTTNGGSRQTTNCLDIVDGQATSGFPATYQVLFLNPQTGRVKESCTGTFISDNTMITAAHCIPLGGPQNFLLLSNQAKIPQDPSQLASAIRAVQTFVDPSVSTLPDGTGRDLGQGQSIALDIGIVIFPDNTAQSWLPLATATAPTGTAVTLVGYGVNNATNPSADTRTDSEKATGTNVLSPPVAQFTQAGVYTTFAWGQPGEAAAHGQNTVSGAPGDSGGPLMVNNTIIGIVSRGTDPQMVSSIQQMVGTDTVDFFADVTNSTAKKLLAQAAAAGARINYAGGVTGGANGISSNSSTTGGNTGTMNGAVTNPSVSNSVGCH